MAVQNPIFRADEHSRQIEQSYDLIRRSRELLAQTAHLVPKPAREEPPAPEGKAPLKE